MSHLDSLRYTNAPRGGFHSMSDTLFIISNYKGKIKRLLNIDISPLYEDPQEHSLSDACIKELDGLHNLQTIKKCLQQLITTIENDAIIKATMKKILTDIVDDFYPDAQKWRNYNLIRQKREQYLREQKITNGIFCKHCPDYGKLCMAEGECLIEQKETVVIDFFSSLYESVNQLVKELKDYLGFVIAAEEQGATKVFWVSIY